MKSLIEEMQKCRSIEQCHEVATVDAYGDEEQASGWLTCLQEMFDKFERVKILGEEVKLKGFDLSKNSVMAICVKGKTKAKVSLDSIEFPKLTKTETLWLSAWKKWDNC